MRRISYLFTFALFFSAADAFASYEVAKTPEEAESIELGSEEVNDPAEGFNRAMYQFNYALDKAFIRPASEVYALAPDFARKGVRNFITNLRSPVTFFNDLLQLEPARAGQTLFRTLINTTIGIGGLFDVATDMGLDYHSEDFGQTLAVAGVGSGPYLVLPVLGPTTPRDVVGRGVDAFLSPANWYWAHEDIEYMGFVIYGVDGLDRRTEARAFTDELEKAIDPYARVRSLYLQSRRYHINNETINEADTPKPID